MGKSSRKQAAGKVVVNPGDVELEDVFAHAKRILSPASMKKADAHTQEIRQSLKGLREILGLRQQDIPGYSQAQISQVESRKDALQSTYRNILNNVGYEMVVLAVPKDPRNATVVLEGGQVVLVRKNQLTAPSDIQIVAQASAARK